MSDSFETLRASAVAGAIVAGLPHRVARRSDDLVELVPAARGAKSSSEIGRHKICMVSLLSTDPQEVNFLAEEARQSIGLSKPLHLIADKPGKLALA